MGVSGQCLRYWYSQFVSILAVKYFKQTVFLISLVLLSDQMEGSTNLLKEDLLLMEDTPPGCN